MRNVFYFDWEFDVLYWFQDIHNSFLDWLMPKITFLGNAGWFWIALIFIMLIFVKDKRYGAQGLFALICTFALCNLVLKPLVGRARPCEIDTTVQLLAKIPSDASFPSGHTNASFTVATAIFTRNKKWGAAALVLATLIAISRMYLFMHFPTDVLVSACIGICGGVMSYFVINWAFKKFSKKVDAN